MENIFLSIYRFFKQRPAVFRMMLVLMFAVFIWRALNINLEEDITRIFPNDERVERLDYVFRNSKLSEKLVVMISVGDSAFKAQPDNLSAYAEKLESEIRQKLSAHISEITARVEDDKVMQLFDIIHEHLPIFMDEKDYRDLDSMITQNGIQNALYSNYKQLISPAGIVSKKVIAEDPLGISFLVLRKLKGLQYDENFELYDSYIVTKDHRHLIFILKPVYAPNDTRGNGFLIDALNDLVATHSKDYPELMVSFFGTSVVALGNARQLQQDTKVTISLTVVLLMIVLLGYFRKKRIPFILMLPAVFGGLFALACISLIKPTLSILAIAVGSIILGVAVDYSLHYLVLLKDLRDSEKAIREVVKPLTIGSFTTVFAFFCLQFTSASVLNDIGLFAGLSLVGAALCALIILPQLVSAEILPRRNNNWVDRMTDYSFENRKPLVYIILLLTPVFFYFASSVKFNSDMNDLNFMTEETRESERRLEAINRSSLSSIYVISSGSSLESALRKNEQSTRRLEKLRDEDGLVHKIASVSSFLLSDSIQVKRIDQWKNYWTAEKVKLVRLSVREAGAKLHFSDLVLNNFDSLLSKNYSALSPDGFNLFRKSFFDDYIIEKDGLATVITLGNVSPKNKAYVYAALEGAPSHRFDRQMLTSLFVKFVHADFTYIATVTSILVFFALLISLGRIELTLVTFIPMLFSWIWILGIMALLGIEFNIVNVMVSTFIFGLGDDYSIFIMDGLQQEYRAGKKILGSIKASIYLSAFTTICGLGVLIFAQHPALKSIAAISIIGIVSVFIMAQTLEPYFFRLLISDRTKNGYTPITFRGILFTIYTYGCFVIGAFFLTVLGLLLKVLPISKRRRRYLFHVLICSFTGINVKGAYLLKVHVVGKTDKTFSNASIIISNHSSFLDILLTAMQHPKVVLLTNKWVWNSPIFGGVVRMADYYPVAEGAQDSVEKLRELTQEGYSVVVFPEGTRSLDARIKRFHKGAFFLAEELNLPLIPLLIHGADKGIRKGEIYVNDATITLKYLPPIMPDDQSFGATYSERAKQIGKYFRNEHAKLAAENETPQYFRDRVITNYIYKGPILEWYARIKLRLEKSYSDFHQLVPAKGSILDLGCGYGFLSYMLQMLSEDRIITGVDYDDEKIATAQNGYLKNDRLNFVCADVTKYPLEKYDSIIISDVLHYLTSTEQEDLISRCFESIRAGGKLIIRDGNRDLLERQKGTWLTEFFSVKLLGFNKSRNELNFISGKHLTALARNRGLSISELDHTRFTSNVIFIISKPLEIHESV